MRGDPVRTGGGSGRALPAALFLVLAIVDVISHRFPEIEAIRVVVILALALALIVLSGFLLANGVRMFRREGRSLATMLSFLAGTAIVGLVALTIALERTGSIILTLVLVLPLLLTAYFGSFFVVFIVRAFIHGRAPVPACVDVLIVLGSGLVSGEISPLLRGRLDRAIEVYRASSAAGIVPLIIPSGGDGPDELRPEGEVMAEYLIDQGIPATWVRAEMKATTTRENLVLARQVQLAAVRDGAVSATATVLVVTSSYHVMRAAMLARDIGSDAQVTGARTARYYVPSAFLREFVAVVAGRTMLHGVLLGLITAAWAVAMVSVVVSR